VFLYFSHWPDSLKAYISSSRLCSERARIMSEISTKIVKSEQTTGKVVRLSVLSEAKQHPATFEDLAYS
jgi:hypothetical protein